MINNQFTKEQEEWLVELETTDKLQGKGYLKQLNYEDKECFCCLGIACEILSPEKFILIEEEDEDGKTKVFMIGNSTAGLPKDIKETLHLKTSLGETITANTWDLFRLNDDYEKSFKEIAAIIRVNLHHYFTNFDTNDI